jgi:hypothetical protein
MSDNGMIFSFESSQELLFQFLELLRTHGIEVEVGSRFDKPAYSLLEVVHLYLGGTTDQEQEEPYQQQRLIDLVGLQDFVAKIVGAKDHRDFPNLLPHLRKINEIEIRLNAPTRVTDQASHKVIELYWGAACMHIAGRVSLEDPRGQRERNPDILATLNATRWGFPCKSLFADKPETLRGNLIKAIDQIEVSPAKVGIPVINMQSIIPYELVWPEGKSFDLLDEPCRILEGVGNRLKEQLLDSPEKEEEIQNLFAGKKAIPGCLMFFQAATGLSRGSFLSPVATRLNRVLPISFVGDQFEPWVTEALEPLNRVITSTIGTNL